MRRSGFRGLALCLCLLMAFTLWTPSGARAASYDTAILDATLDHIRQTVTDPVCGSIGGEWAVLALARGGVKDDAWYEKYLENLGAVVDECGGVLSSRKYTEYSRVILALSSLGVDATCLDTGKGVYDLVSPLLKKQSSGAYWASWQGNNGTVFAIIALNSRNYFADAAGRTVRAGLIDALLKAQKADGGWSISGGSTDIDTSAMALQALGPYYLDEGKYRQLKAEHSYEELCTAVENALGYLKSVSSSDYGSVEAAAQVVVALAALDRDAANDPLLGNALASVLAYYDKDGAFKHTKDGSAGDNRMSTEQAAYAMVAYDRWKRGSTSLYDMTDVPPWGAGPVEYTVSFAPGGGSGTMAAVVVKEGEKLTLPECAFTAPRGQRFKAWSFGGREYAPGQKLSITADGVVTALWEEIPPASFTVSFSAGGGSGKMADVTVKEGETLTLPECAFTAPKGQRFRAWSVGGREYAPGQQLGVGGDLTVRALWEDIPPVSFTVSFEAGGGSGKMADVTGVAGDFTLPECTFTAPAGMEYRSWEIGGAEYLPFDVYRVEADTVVTALWQDAEDPPEEPPEDPPEEPPEEPPEDPTEEPPEDPIEEPETFLVSFSAGGGSGSMEDVVCVSGPYRLPECRFEAPEGKTFRAWRFEGEEYAPGETVVISRDTVIRALWEKLEKEPAVIATVCFRLEGGKGSGLRDGDTLTYTEEDEGAPLPVVSRDGYDFDGWYDRRSGGKRYSKVSAALPEVLYARWTEAEEDKKVITVTMRLIGARLAQEDVDLGEAEYLPDYVTWIRTTEYELEEGAKVYDLWVLATEEAGIRSVGAARNYVSTVYAPDALGGYELSEFTNGKRSGWMYTINGKHPGFGLKEQELEDGDEVIWHYVNDYSYEVDDWFSEGQWQALGDGRYYNRWLLAPDRFGGKGGGLSESAEEEKKEDEDKDKDKDKETPEEKVKGDTVTVTPQVEDGEAKATVEEDAVAEALESCEDDTLTVAVETRGADSVEVTLTPEAVEAVSQAGADLHIETEIGTVKLDPDTLGDLNEAGKEVTVTVQAGEDGATRLEVTVDGKPADVTVKVELPAAAGGQVLVAMYADGTEEVVKKSLLENGIVYAELPAGAAVRIIENSKDFEDVKDSDWFSEAVDFASSHELFVGVSETEFAPKLPMTRAMLVTVLFRLEDEPETAALTVFDDVKDDTWYTEAVEWAAAQGIVSGVGNNCFAPNDNVTREQLAAMLYRYAQYLGLDVSGRGSLDAFFDGDQVSSWAKDAMRWAVKIGLFQGDDTGCLNPKNNVTRTEVTALMQRLVAYLVK